MVGMFDVARCGDCCDPEWECLREDGTGSTVDCSGTWSVSAGDHSTASDDALRYFTSEEYPPYGWHMSCIVTPDVTLTGIRKYGSYQAYLGGLWGCSDYAFIRYTHVRPAHTDIGAFGYYLVELGIVESGVETILAQHPHDHEACADEVGGFQEVDEGDSVEELTGTPLTLCWDGDTLTGTAQWDSIGGSTFQFVKLSAHKKPGSSELSSIIPVDGIHLAIGTGTLSTEIIDIEFSDIRFVAAYSYEGVADPEHADCEVCDYSCCASPQPETLILEISGFASARSDTSNCDIDCADLNGTYFLTRSVGIDGDGVPRECSGDGICAWAWQGTIDAECETEPLTPTTTITLGSGTGYLGFIEACADVGFGHGYSVGTSIDVATQGHVPGMSFSLLHSSPTQCGFACDEWDDWIEMVILPGLHNACVDDAATIRVKADI